MARFRISDSNGNAVFFSNETKAIDAFGAITMPIEEFSASRVRSNIQTVYNFNRKTYMKKFSNNDIELVAFNGVVKDEKTLKTGKKHKK